MTTLGERIAHARTEAGLTQGQLGIKVGVGQGQISKLEQGLRRRSTKLVEIAQATGVDPGWLSTGRGEMKPSRSYLAEPPIDYAQATADLQGFAPLFAWEHHDELPPGDFVAIPRMEVRLSAGPGAVQPEFDLVKERPQIFAADWIRRRRLRPDALRVMYAVGNSMEPRIYESDALVVDLSQTAIVDGKVFALYYDGLERVKRVSRRPGGGLIIASDNEKEHPVMALTADEASEVRIIGRIVNTSGHEGL